MAKQSYTQKTQIKVSKSFRNRILIQYNKFQKIKKFKGTTTA